MPSPVVSVAIGLHAGGGLLLAALASLHDVQALFHGRCCYHGAAVNSQSACIQDKSWRWRMIFICQWLPPAQVHIYVGV
jgi:hypothetical protein